MITPSARPSNDLTSSYHGWVVVAGGFAVLFVAYGAQYSFGVFFAAMLAEFGWSRGSLSDAFSLYTFAYCVLGFAAGRLTDRWGPRVVIAAGGVFLGSALVGMSLVADSLSTLYAAAFTFGFSYGAVTALFASIIGDFVGRERAGSLVGVFFAVAGASTALGPVGAGAIHDATGSYTLAFALSAALNLAGLVTLALARPPTRPRD